MSVGDNSRLGWVKRISRGLKLEIGCADAVIFVNTDQQEWVGVDTLSDMRAAKVYDELLPKYALLWKNRNVIIADGYKLPFRDEIFDTEVYAEVLEHVPTPNEFLQLGVRHLKDKGAVIITVPDEGNWDKSLNPGHNAGHVDIIDEKKMRTIIKVDGLIQKLFYHTPPFWNNGFIYFYAVLQKVFKQ